MFDLKKKKTELCAQTYADDFFKAMIAYFSLNIIIILKEYFSERSSADSKVLGPGVGLKIREQGTVMGTCKSRAQITV